MDIMRIESGFMRKAAAKLLASAVRKKFGADVRIEFNDAVVIDSWPDPLKNSNELAHVHLNMDIFMSKEELKKFFDEKENKKCCR